MFVSVRDRILDLVYPPRCLVCAAFLRGDNTERADLLHHACADGLLYERKKPRPPRAAMYLESTFAAFSYGTPAVQRNIVALKYYGRTALAAPLARHVAAAVRGSGYARDADVIVACPLHYARRRKRGYNQADLLAAEVAAELNIVHIPDPHPAAAAWLLAADASQIVRSWREIGAWRAMRGTAVCGLVRVRQTRPQVGLKADARLRNVDGAFAWYGDTLGIVGKCVIVLDDVRTTGATLDACAVALRDAGAARVLGLTLAA